MTLRSSLKTIAAMLRRERPQRATERPRRLARFESLEDRILFSADFIGIPLWEPQGPAPIINTGSDGGLTSGNAIVAPNNPATGGVQAIAVNPNNAQQIYVGTVNGGIWRTNNADPANPGAIAWTPLTDQQVSTAIGAIAFSPLDGAGNTLYAGTGTFSNLYWFNPPPTTAGILRTTDGGATWSNFAVNPANEGRIKAILPTGIDLDAGPGVQEMILVATIDGGTGIWRSNNNGETFALLSGANGLLGGAVSQLIADPNNGQRFYAGVPGQGVYRGDFDATTGVITWAQVNTGLTNLGTSANIQLAVHDDGANTVLYAGVAAGVSGISATLNGVFRSTDNGANWNPLGAPNPFNAFSLAGSGFSLVADPANNQTVYVSGLATTNDVARFRPGTNDWVSIVGASAQNGTQPHTDSRDLAFIGNNVLLDACDGGLYFLQNPTDAANNQWRSFNQGLGPIEFHDIAWDSNSDIIIGGAQDNGTSYQQTTNGLVWTQPLGADGADVAVDNLTLAGANQSIRYFSFQNLGQFRRQVFGATNATVGAAVNLLPAGGLANFTTQFITPIEVNVIAPPAGQSARLVVGGGGTSPVYESTNAGTAAAGSITWTAVPVGAGFGTVTTLAAGGRLNGADNAEVLYAGDSNGRVYVRSTAGGTLTATTTVFPGANVADIALDPNDWQHAFVASSSGVWETTNAGGAWVNRTGNLSNNIIQTIEFAELGATDAVLVGGEGGVFRMITNNPGVWSEYGRALPNAVTYDLDYNAADNVLIAGTFGRGAWKVTNASTTLTVLGLLRITGQSDADTIELRREAGNPPMLDVFLDGALDASIEFATLDRIEVNGLGGDDLLIVNLANGDVIPANNVAYDGGADTDTLDLRGATFGTVTYNPTGPTSGSVRLGGSDLVTYTGAEQVTDRTVATNRVFNGTAGDDTIRIVDGASELSRINDSGAADFAQHDFANPSASLNVNGGGGADDIHLIGVDPGFAATVNLAGGAGDDAIAVDFGALVSVVNVSGNDDEDTLTVNGTILDDTILVTGSAVTRSGQAVNYDSTVEHLIVDGAAGDDDFTIDGAAGEILGGSGLDTYLVIASAAPQLRLNGQGDSDDYTVNFGDLDGPVVVQDLGPLTDTDTLLINGTADPDTIVVSATDVTSGGETVSYSGIEELTVDAGGGDDSITINSTGVDVDKTTILGGDGDDKFVVNGSGPGSLRLDGQEDSDSYTINLGGVFTGPIEIDDTGLNGTDSLNINGTSGDDWIILTDTGFTVGGLPASFTFAGIELLTVNAGAGDDIVDGSALTMKVTIFGGTGDDTLIGGSNDDQLYGEDDDDDLIGNLGADFLDGGAGSDALIGDQCVQGDKGRLEHEAVIGPARILSIPSGKLAAVVDVPGTNRRLVTLRNETLGGVDTLIGGTGDDYAYGGAGNDVIRGGDGADALFGNLGDDDIGGDNGDDHLYGGSGNDLLNGNAGADIAYGGDGDDRLVADVKADRLIDWFGNFNDFVVPGPGYGAPTIVRSPSPWVQDFLLNLARADGAANPNSQIVVVVPGGDLQRSNSGKGGRT